MGKVKTKTKSGSGKDILHSTNAPLVKAKSKHSNSLRPIEDLLTEAATLLEQSQPEVALPLVEEALQRLEEEREAYSTAEKLFERASEGQPTFPEALVLGADVNLALGDADTARIQFLRATRIDPDGALISAEPWLWLSQLCEEGGQQSIEYFDKAAEVLRNEIELLEEAEGPDQNREVLEEKKSKLADTLCGMTEVYMTDLSWETDAEQRCEQFVTEAVAVCPDYLSAGPLQVLASVRISQQRTEEARRALATSMTLWKDLPQELEHPARPDFATRVSLARLLMEVEAEDEATFVIDGLIKEDDESIESLYLGGWCQVLLSQKPTLAPEERSKHQELAKQLLESSLRLYQKSGYEDEKLKEHALELVRELGTALGVPYEEDDGWEDAEDDEDDGNEDEIEVNDLERHDGDVEMT